MVDFFAGQIPTAQQLEDTALVGTVVAQLRQTVAQSVPDTTPTVITFTTEDYDILGGHSTVTNPSRYTCQREGWYQLLGAVAFVGSTLGTYRACRWRVNSLDLNAGQIISTPVASNAFATVAVARPYMVYLVVGDFVELAGEQNTGGALNTSVVTVTGSNMQLMYAGLPN